MLKHILFSQETIMSELQTLIDTPIGAVFFVSGAISVFILLLIFLLRKGSDLHGILGYIYFFGLAFSNYAAAMAFYGDLLPLASIAITIPISTISLVIGLAAIIPNNKSLLRIRVHIFSVCISTISVSLGTLINWYHFNIGLLDAFRWMDLGSLALLSAPVLVVGGIITYYFFAQSSKHFERIKRLREIINPFEISADVRKIGSRNQTILRKKKGLSDTISRARKKES